jgi:hypothetical protein
MFASKRRENDQREINPRICFNNYFCLFDLRKYKKHMAVTQKEGSKEKDVLEKELIPNQHNPQRFGYLVAEQMNHFKYIHENVHR